MNPTERFFDVKKTIKKRFLKHEISGVLVGNERGLFIISLETTY